MKDNSRVGRACRRAGAGGALVLVMLLTASCVPDPAAQARSLPGASADDPAGSEPSGTPSPTATSSAETPTSLPEAGGTIPGSVAPTVEPSVPPSPPPPPPPLADVAGLAEGDQGEGVLRLEQRLAELSYPPGPVNETFDVQTTRAVQVFQADHDLRSSGRLDRRTIEALAVAAPAEVLAPGSEGPAVRELQQQLNEGTFDAGPVDGQYGTMTAQAIYAVQKLHGYPVTGTATPVERMLAGVQGIQPRLLTGPGGRRGLHVEVDLGQQLVAVFRDGELVLATHASSGNRQTFCTDEGGCRRAVTPTGDYTISRRIGGWRTSELGRLYNPLYFNGGIAFHGAYSVPTYPASHGCVRLPMHIAEYLPDLLPNGTPVVVR